MWTVIITGCVSVSLVMSLAFCLCWRKKSPKNDLLGLDGMVIQKNPDENVNHLPSAAPCVVYDVNAAADNAEINESNKRTVPSNNTRRSLPDIPNEQVNAVNWEPTGDNSSEHYATVGQYQNVKRHIVPNGVETRPSMSQHSSISQTDDTSSPYEKVKYDKIKSKEHPYAQLQPTTSRQSTEEANLVPEERTSLLRPDGSTTSSEPSAPPRSRRSSAHSGIGVDIPAASAVAGGVAASPDLPYMTPPVTQPNFSGDSQDSSKGYTSISVREPLANIMAQTKQLNKKRELDPHYSTVSDDSDDVYTTIPDPNNQIYTSESETYARIPAHPITVEAEVNPTPGRCMEYDELYETGPQPPPPSVDSLKQMATHSHSRQASSSSSIANVGSPKPEKRQANSPLPPPPPVPNFESAQRNLDDLYAKVHKNKKKEDSDGEKTPERGKKSSDNISRKSVSSCSSSEDKKYSENRHKDHNYETLRKSNRDCNDPGYEKIRNEEPGYASINGPESITSSDPGYEVLKQRPLSESDPNYEELQHGTSNASDCAGYSKIKYNTVTDGYSVINKQKSDEKSRTSSSYGSNSHDLSLDEPNYESMPSESLSSEHNYAALKSTGSESDPNYETVNQNDPNYESVRDLEESPYERLQDGDPSKESDIQGYGSVTGRGYENIDTSESSNGTSSGAISKKAKPPYEHLNNDTDSEVPGYEKVQSSTHDEKGSSDDSPSRSGKSDSNCPIGKDDKPKAGNAHSLLEEDAIFQV